MRGLGSDVLSVVRPTRDYLLVFFYSGIQLYILVSPYLCFIIIFCLLLHVLGDDSSIS